MEVLTHSSRILELESINVLHFYFMLYYYHFSHVFKKECVRVCVFYCQFGVILLSVLILCMNVIMTGSVLSLNYSIDD